MKSLKLVLCTIIASTAGLTTSHAQYSIFLKTVGPDIKGDATGGGFTEAWRLTSFAQGINNPPTIGSGGTTPGTPDFQDVAIGKFLDRASVPIFLRTAQGALISKVIITLTDSSSGKAEVLYTVTLEQVTISSVNQNAAGSTELPLEQVSFAFEKITWKYGLIEEFWDQTP